MTTKVTAVFDIGKTNKKFYLMDDRLQVVTHVQQKWAETTDDDGFASDDLQPMMAWMKDILFSVLEDEQYKITAINFSGYGASMVHLTRQGNLATPFYNYLKPLPADIPASFYTAYGPQPDFCRDTASPALGLLNSGLQLYFLKYAKPHLFKNVHTTLHLPQFLSYLFTGKYFSDYTSLGCHTGLWHFKNQTYHHWVNDEQLTHLLAPLAPAPWIMSAISNSHKTQAAIRVGIGIHDSSAALQPYLLSTAQKFILLSTGTWSIALNPFSAQLLTDEDLNHDVLYYLRPDGLPVRAARLFLGQIHENMTHQVAGHFKVDTVWLTTLKFNAQIFAAVRSSGHLFPLPHLPYYRRQPAEILWSALPSPEYAYHQLIWELVQEQMAALRRCAGDTEYQVVFLDGGFAENNLFKTMLALSLGPIPLGVSKLAAGSALGAALMVSKQPLAADQLAQLIGLQQVSVETN